MSTPSKTNDSSPRAVLMMEPQQVYSIDEAAEFLRMSRTTVYALMRTTTPFDYLPSVKPHEGGRRRVIRRQALEDWLERHEEQ